MTKSSFITVEVLENDFDEKYERARSERERELISHDAAVLGYSQAIIPILAGFYGGARY